MIRVVHSPVWFGPKKPTEPRHTNFREYKLDRIENQFKSNQFSSIKAIFFYKTKKPNPNKLHYHEDRLRFMRLNTREVQTTSTLLLQGSSRTNAYWIHEHK